MDIIQTDSAPAAIGTYSQAVKVDKTVYISGQIPLCPNRMLLVSEAIEAQIQQVFLNLAAVCDAAGGSLAQIVKLNIYLCDLSHFPLVNRAMEQHFQAPFPARAAVEVSALPKGAQVEAEAVMVLT